LSTGAPLDHPEGLTNRHAHLRTPLRLTDLFTGKGARKPRRSRRGGMALPGIFLV
jgi:hypothetical protein